MVRWVQDFTEVNENEMYLTISIQLPKNMYLERMRIWSQLAYNIQFQEQNSTQVAPFYGFTYE